MTAQHLVYSLIQNEQGIVVFTQVDVIDASNITFESYDQVKDYLHQLGLEKSYDFYRRNPLAPDNCQSNWGTNEYPAVRTVYGYNQIYFDTIANKIISKELDINEVFSKHTHITGIQFDNALHLLGYGYDCRYTNNEVSHYILRKIPVKKPFDINLVTNEIKQIIVLSLYDFFSANKIVIKPRTITIDTIQDYIQFFSKNGIKFARLDEYLDKHIPQPNKKKIKSIIKNYWHLK